jgi:hypothetical protein
MKQFWVILGVCLSLSGIAFLLGEIITIGQKEVLSDEVLTQSDKIPASFDSTTLLDLYNSREQVEITKIDLLNYEN